MSQKVVDRLSAQFGDRILESSCFRGDDEVCVAPKDWVAVARFLRDDPACAMDHYVYVTAVDYPERAPGTPRFDVLLFVRSLEKLHRVRVKTHVEEGQELDSLVDVYQGANWSEREVFDMFGIRFRGHPDLRRILMYEEFEGHPLRKDYPIEKTQPLVAYRDVEGVEKLAPFGKEEGQPWNRIDWLRRMSGRDLQVSPAIATQVGQKPALSIDPVHLEQGQTHEE
jgi:NADH-quinone oxidoreductase subunit C